MNDRVPLQLPSRTFLALAAYLQESGCGADAEEVAATAIAEWIAQERARAEAGRSGLAGMLERSIEARQPLYRRRTDLLADD